MMPWQTLGVSPDADERAIKRAYAGLIRQFRPDTHAAEFARVREAYEDALRQLRRRAEFSADTDLDSDDTPTDDADIRLQDAYDTGAAPTPGDHFNEGTGDRDAGATLQQEAAEAAANFNPAEWCNEIAGLARAGNEDGAFACFQRHLDALSGAGLDERLAYADALLQSLIWSESPSLLVFAHASRLFGWDGGALAARMATGGWGLRRFDALHDLSAVYLDGRYATLSVIRCMFDPLSKRPPWLGWRTSVLMARGFARHWRESCERSELPGLIDRLRPTVLRRVLGPMVHSTDVFLAMLVALFIAITQPSIPPDWTFGAAAAMSLPLALLPWLGRALKSRWRHSGFAPLRSLFARFPTSQWITAAIVLAFVSLFIGDIVAADAAHDSARYITGRAITAAAGIVLLGFPAVLVWAVLMWIETMLFTPLIRARISATRAMVESQMTAGVKPVVRPTGWALVRAIPPSLWAEYKSRRSRRQVLKADNPKKSRTRIFGLTSLSWLGIIYALSMLVALLKN